MKTPILPQDQDHLMSQIEVLSRENASLIYFVLRFFGKLRPRDIKKFTGINTGRMYNEIALLYDAKLVQKVLLQEGKTEKPFYEATENPLDMLDFGDIDLSDISQIDPLTLTFMEAYLKYSLKFPSNFQNFISKVATNAVSEKIAGRQIGAGDFKNHQEIIKVDKTEYDILHSKFASLMYDISKLQESSSGNSVAISLSLLYIETL